MDIPSFADPVLRRKKAVELREQGVVFINIDQVYIADDVEVGEGTVIFPGVVLETGTHIGKHCIVRPNAVISASNIGDGCFVGVGAHIEQSTLQDKCEVEHAQIKRSNLGRGTKAKHHSYIGDAEIGEKCNIGAGTVFCNYDGSAKHKTVLEDHVFVGSGSMLIAPLHVAQNAYIGANSVVSKNVPPNTLVLARGQKEKGLIEAIRLLVEVLQQEPCPEHCQRTPVYTKVLEILRSLDPQVHKEGYVVQRTAKGWRIQKPA